jgi:Na+(H+)/acetate symporter ActP
MFDLDTPRRISLLIVLVYAAVYFIAVQPRTGGMILVSLFQIAGYFLLPLACTAIIVFFIFIIS